MKFLFLATVAALICSLAFTYRSAGIKNQVRLQKIAAKKMSASIGCSPDWSTFRLSAEKIQQMVPLPGTGSHSWKINTTSDSAQFYFNQGMNLYYGFHIIEAIPSFKKAQLFDPGNVMLYWAEALAYGPNINDLGYTASPEALSATEKAVSLGRSATQKERALIEAMQVRYSADSVKSRKELNELYAGAMRKAYLQFPNDPEISTLYADALMLLHPWDLWEHNGTAKPWTPEIMKVLEKTLRHAPDHPGANHYYIHTVEASPFPWKAAKSADRLGSLTPGLSHMVHMPSHIYIRTGQYDKGIQVNTEAVSQYNTYKQLYPDVMNNAPLYEYHNRHMQAACSMNGTDFDKAIKDAGDCRNSFDTSFMSLPAPIGNYIQYIYMTPVFTLVTFEKWDELLKQPAIADHHTHALALKHFSEGMAYANTRQPDKAAASLANMEALMNNKSLAIRFGPSNAPISGITVAKHILMGAIAENGNKPDEALKHYQEAVKAEDAMVYDEPKSWLVPSRHFLGNHLLERKKYAEAEKIFRQDLKNHPNNYTSRKGLEACMQKKGKKA